jgi:hypothetical protein
MYRKLPFEQMPNFLENFHTKKAKGEGLEWISNFKEQHLKINSQETVKTIKTVYAVGLLRDKGFEPTGLPKDKALAIISHILDDIKKDTGVEVEVEE